MNFKIARFARTGRMNDYLLHQLTHWLCGLVMGIDKIRYGNLRERKIDDLLVAQVGGGELLPATTLANVNMAHVAITVAIGLAFVLAVAWSQREASWRINTFFVGGRNIGAPLAAQTFWGSSFSFANGIIYFAALGYAFGLSVIWFQIPWVAGISILAWRLPQLIKITQTYTLHGFLGSLYGPKVRLIASVVTIVGFMGIFAYEIAIATEVVATALQLSTALLLVIFLVGIYVAAHADVGGYAGAARTDRVQNLLGMVVVVLAIYFIIALPGNSVNRTNLKLDNIIASFLNIASVPWPVWFGALCFTLTINLVDMSHWQSIAANSKVEKPEELRAFRLAIIKSGLWMMVFPAATGAFIGYAWKGVQGVNEATLLPATLAGFPGGSGDLSGFVAGFLILGFLAVGFSTASGYLLASVQTASWDALHYSKLFVPGRKAEAELSEYDQESIVLQARLVLYILAIVSIAAFMLARHAVGDDRFLPLQFVLGAILVSLFPATAYALYLESHSKDATPATSWLMLLSILFGFFAGLCVYFQNLIFATDLNSVFQWAPVASLSCSLAIAGLAILVNKPTKLNSDSTASNAVRGDK
jgi:hypothetical protein